MYLFNVYMNGFMKDIDMNIYILLGWYVLMVVSCHCEWWWYTTYVSLLLKYICINFILRLNNFTSIAFIQNIYIYHWLHQWQLPESNCQWHAVIYMYVYESICNMYVIHKASVNVYMYISIILYLFNVYQWSYWHMIDIAKNKMWYVHVHYCYCRICVIFYMIDCMHLFIGW